ncbi:MAG: uroporphyrinogen decarboxylase [Planctomycetota bacterium]|mgnify:FL=1|jgi:uroporphyrinogen decarboxylase|nr:uroporphyrinogen decarboxylase [Planctomycetota bacterium]
MVSDGESLDPADESSFSTAKIGAFESRRADDLKRLIEKFGGQAHVSASMREVQLDDQREAIDFAHRLLVGDIDVVVLLTGVGFRYLMNVVSKHVDQERLIHSLTDVVTVARGPKPAAVMREFGLQPTYRVPEPNTWREILTTMDAELSLNSQTVALQLYGKVNPSLIAGLEARGAKVVSVPIYRWDFPESTVELEKNVHRLVSHELDMVMFTSAHQLVNLIKLARRLNLEQEVVTGLNQTVVASIGPTTSEMIREYGIEVDFEPSHPKMGHLVSESARHFQNLQFRKQNIRLTMSNPASDSMDTKAPWYDSPFMKACRREPTEVTPVWLMRQAGRYMQEYRSVRSQVSFLELCKNPQLCSEVMCTAVNRLGVDAAIIFSDLLPILEPMGLELEFAKGEGPVIHNPVRESQDVDRIVELETVDELDFVIETVRQTRLDLPADMPLIGFAGSPFTLASYTIEGGSSRTYTHTKALMYRDEGAWRILMEKFARAVVIYLNAQIAAGAQCVQLFDSWVGCLGPGDYRRYVLPYMKQILEGITPGVPVINFGTGNPELLPHLAEAGGSVIGVDWRIPLDKAWQTIGYHKAVQGNMDPMVLLGEQDLIKRRVQEVLDQAGGRPGHIFNLGHGVVQQTPVENAIAVIDYVHELSQR